MGIELGKDLTKSRVFIAFGVMVAIAAIAIAFAGAFAPATNADAHYETPPPQYPGYPDPSYPTRGNVYTENAPRAPRQPAMPRAPFNVSPSYPAPHSMYQQQPYSPYLGARSYPPGYGYGYAPPPQIPTPPPSAHPLQVPMPPQPYPPPGAPDPAGVPVIREHGGTFNAGWTTYFVGRSFGSNEQIFAFFGGAYIGSTETDAGGAFALGIPIPSVPGFYTYTFIGQRTGRTASATILAVH